MGHAFVEWLSQVEGGQELLVNLTEALRDGCIDLKLAQAFAKECVTRLDEKRAAGLIDPSVARNIVNYVVFDPPRDPAGQSIQFQYAARRGTPTPGAVETYLTWQKLWSLVPPGSALAEEIEKEVDESSFDTSDARYLDHDDMEAVARLVNALGPATPGFRVSKQTASGASLPIWMTIAEHRDALRVLDEELLATRIRDWLGLGFAIDGVPFFAFQSRDRLDAAATGNRLSRPTIFDGIDHGWFKHRLHGICRHQWGRTLDFVPARHGDSDCDGGPEAIAPGSEFGALYECRYVGRLMSSPMPSKPFVLKALLAGTTDRDEELVRIETELEALLEMAA